VCALDRLCEYDLQYEVALRGGYNYVAVGNYQDSFCPVAKLDHPVRVFRLENLCLNFKARQIMSLCVACWKLERKSRKQFLLLFGNNWGLIFLGNQFPKIPQNSHLIVIKIKPGYSVIIRSKLYGKLNNHS